MYTLIAVLVIALVGAFVLVSRYNKRFVAGQKSYRRYTSYWGFVGDDGASFFGWIITILFAGIFCTMIFGMCLERSNHRAEYEQKVILRDSIVFLMEDTKDKYKDSVYQAVVDFNSSVTEHRVKQNTFNWGIEYPNDLDWNDIPLIVPKGEYTK